MSVYSFLTDHNFNPDPKRLIVYESVRGNNGENVMSQCISMRNAQQNIENLLFLKAKNLQYKFKRPSITMKFFRPTEPFYIDINPLTDIFLDR